MKTCILTVIKNENEYLDNWIKYHLKLGIDHIFIGEDFDSQSHKNITNNYSSEKVTLLQVIDFYDTNEKREKLLYEKSHSFVLQNSYFRNGIQYIKNNYSYNWCFIIDIDEYITIKDNHKSINDVMVEFQNYDAVILQWENYGANGLVYKPDYKEKSIIETYTQKTGFPKLDDRKWFEKVKTVYNINTYNNTCASNRLPTLNCNWCKTDFTKDRNKLVYDKVYIRHYFTKSWEEYVWKLYIRGMFHPKHRSYDSFFETNPDLIDRKEELIEWANNFIISVQGTPVNL